VDEQFERGVVDEVKQLLDAGVPPEARPFGGLVYRQIMEMLRGERDEPSTRALIVQENRRYARRQLIWLRKEPNLVWLEGPGDRPDVLRAVHEALAARPAADEHSLHPPSERPTSSLRASDPDATRGKQENVP
jgi:tRNA A37 N6-isopentenylltransferase MiaA